MNQIQPIGYEEGAQIENERVSSANGFCVIESDGIELFEDKLTLRLEFSEPVFYTAVSMLFLPLVFQMALQVYIL